MPDKCVICQLPKPSLFSLSIPDFDSEEAYTVKICGKCWDVIATIAQRAVGEHCQTPTEVSK